VIRSKLTAEPKTPPGNQVFPMHTPGDMPTKNPHANLQELVTRAIAAKSGGRREQDEI
jgi:hypothetical protein